MIFSSTVFLFQFLPVALLLYYTTVLIFRKQQYANAILVLVSLAFYYLGSGYLVLLILASIGTNFGLGRLIARSEGRPQKEYLAAGIIANLGVLMYFKYAAFLLHTATSVAALFGSNVVAPAIEIALPVGISFYTFMSISYLVDVYKDRNDARSLGDYAVYLSLFPHLVAGPIVRYSELRSSIVERNVSADMFLHGMFRFSIGVARKVIVADSLAVVADRIFALPQAELTTSIAWLGVVAYAFQIFYDFSGYTDMAIGLAKMFGFTFPENFNQPYTAGSVTEFWRRWHMTLTRWFRDYLYIPLGGNRVGSTRTYVNLFAVFFLCGLWHGAAWTFVLWGMYHGLLLVVERVLKNRLGFEPRGPLGVIVTFVLVTVGWVFFRSTSIGGAFAYLATMLGAVNHANVLPTHAFGDFLTASTAFYLVIAICFALVPSEMLAPLKERSKAALARGSGFPFALAKGSVAVFALLLSIAYASESTFRPFIYFRF